jgi:hypothetical protein
MKLIADPSGLKQASIIACLLESIFLGIGLVTFYQRGVEVGGRIFSLLHVPSAYLISLLGDYVGIGVFLLVVFLQLIFFTAAIYFVLLILRKN